MTEAEFRRSVRETQPILEALGVFRSGFFFRDPSEEFRRAAFGGESYPAVYRVGLEQRDYAFLLEDLSYFQLQRLEIRGGYALRYGYLPNPYRYRPFESFLDEFDMAGSDPHAIELYHQYLEEQPAVQDIPPLRFDVDFDAYKPMRHPCCHLHVGHNTGARWPVERVLTPKTFVLFITKWFYAEAWADSSQSLADSMYFDRELQVARAASAVLPDAQFCADERLQPYLA